MSVCQSAGDRPSAPRRTRQILEAAETCFRLHGFHATSMAQIATTAGMSVGHIYRYFASKNEIIAAIVERDVTSIMAAFESIEDGADPLQRILDYLAVVAERMARPESRALWLEVMAEAARNPAVADIVRDTRRKITAGLYSLLKSGCSQAACELEMTNTADMLVMMIDSVALRSVGEPDFTPQKASEQIVKQANRFFSLLFAAEPAQASRPSAISSHAPRGRTPVAVHD